MSELMPKTHEPCWHCTSKSFTIPYAQNGGRYILCGSCGAASPVKDTEILARIAWNNRPREEDLQADNDRLRGTLLDVGKYMVILHDVCTRNEIKMTPGIGIIINQINIALKEANHG